MATLLAMAMPVLLRTQYIRGGATSPPPEFGDLLLVISPGDSASAGEADQLYQTCTALACCGVRRLLLREPHLSRAQIKRLVQLLLPLYPHDGLLIHEKCAGAREIAEAHGLGLHLTSKSDWAAERAAFRGPLGVSAHSNADVLHASECGCQWAFLSPVSRPTSKPGDVRPPIGEAAILCAQRSLPDIDVVALGGVTPAAAARLVVSGGRGVAVLGGIFSSGHSTAPEDACNAATAYLDALRQVTGM